MSSSKRRGKDDDFIDAGAGGDSSDSGADEPESDVESNDSDAGPSTGAGRPKRARRPPGAKRGPKDKAPKSGTKTIGGKGKGKGKAWEGTFEHTWDSVREDAQGSLESAVSDLLLSGKNKRCVCEQARVQAGELTAAAQGGEGHDLDPARHHSTRLPRARPLARHARARLQAPLARPHAPIRPRASARCAPLGSGS